MWQLNSLARYTVFPVHSMPGIQHCSLWLNSFPIEGSWFIDKTRTTNHTKSIYSIKIDHWENVNNCIYFQTKTRKPEKQTKRIHCTIRAKHTLEWLRWKQLGLLVLEQHASTAAAAVKAAMLASRQIPNFMIVQHSQWCNQPVVFMNERGVFFTPTNLKTNRTHEKL